MTTIVLIILGVLLLFAGRKLFWLFVGAVGFVVGMYLASRFISGNSELLVLVIALVAGLIGAGLAVAMQNLAIGLAGFLAGAYSVITLLSLTNLHLGSLEWLLVVVGGILGAVLVSVLFEWALIILSAFTGASMLVQAFHVNRPLESVLITVLFVIGLSVQLSIRQRERSHSAPAPAAPSQGISPAKDKPKTP
jgi:hypothetical protein